MEAFLAHFESGRGHLLLQVCQTGLYIVLLLAWLLLKFSGKGIRLWKSYLKEHAKDDPEEVKRLDPSAACSATSSRGSSSWWRACSS